MLTRLFPGLRAGLSFSCGVFLAIDAQRLELREGLAFDGADRDLRRRRADEGGRMR